jgi:hypothetical protein
MNSFEIVFIEYERLTATVRQDEAGTGISEVNREELIEIDELRRAVFDVADPDPVLLTIS